jgi:DNA (cytosine-5)-methyltransferase 1
MNEYLKKLKLLKPNNNNGFTVLDLFAGCGGLALGFETHGFQTIGYECNHSAAETYRNNLKGKCFEEFITVDFTFPKADLIIGG